MSTTARLPERETSEVQPRPSRSQASVGAFWSFAGYGGSQVIRLLGNLILTRLLFEEAFGLMAIVAVFSQGLQLLSDIGVGPNIVQNERGDDPRFLNTAWCMQIGRGLALWLLACAGAPLFASFYDQPLFAQIIPAATFTAFIAGFNSTKLYSQLRKLQLARFVSIDLVSSLAGAICMVAWAFVDRSVWALVAGGIVASVLKLILSHTILPGHANKLEWDPAAARAIFRFGGWIFVSTSLTYFDRHAHNLVFAKLIPWKLMGVYSIGVIVATFPPLALGHLATNVLFPLYSRTLNRGEEVAPVFKRARFSVLMIAGWCLSGFIAGGQIAIDLCWDDRYAGAGWMLRVLSAGAWLSIMEQTNGSAFLAHGKAHMLAFANAGKLIGMVVLIPLGFQVAGFPGAVTAYAATELCKYAISALTISRIGLSDKKRDLFLCCGVAIAAMTGSYAGELARTHSGSNLFAALTVFVVVSLAWAPLFVVWKRKCELEGRSLLGD